MWLPTHFLYVPLALLLMLLTGLLSKRIPTERRARICRTVWVLLLLSEGVKQLEGVLTGAFSPTYYPFHYSTTFYVSIALYSFGRGRVHHYGGCALLVSGVLLLGTFLLNPYAVVGDTSALTTSYFCFHSYAYHVAVLCVWAAMLADNSYRVWPFDALRYLSFLLGWGILAVPAAHLTGANYAGLLSSYLPALEALRLRAGDGAYLAAYAATALLVACAILSLYARITRQKAE